MVLLCTDGGRLSVEQVWRGKENCFFTHNTSDTICMGFLIPIPTRFPTRRPII